MSKSLIASTARGMVNPLRFQGIAATDSHAQIQSVLKNALSAEHALLFAEPVQDAAGHTIDWYSEAQNPAPLLSLPQDKQNTARAAMARIAQDIEALAQSLKAESQGPKVLRGNILSLALHYPGEEYLYVAGDQPILTGWGFGPATLGLEPAFLPHIAPLIPAASTPAGAAATPLTAPPVSRASAGIGPFRALAGFILGLALLMALFFLAAILFAPAGCPQPATLAGCREKPAAAPSLAGCSATLAPGGEKQPEPPAALVSALTAEKEKELSLRRQAEALRRQLSELMAQCPRTAPARLPAPLVTPEAKPVAPPEAQNPPSLAELMPTTPEPKAPEPSPGPLNEKPVPPKAPRPEKSAPPLGSPLKIPKNPNNNDLSFLEGCWQNSTTLKDARTRKPIRSTYCFDKNGRGTRTEQGIGHDMQCRSSASASFVGGKLRISAGKAQCSGKGRGDFHYPEEAILCDREQDGTAQCYESQRDRWKAKLTRVR